MIAIEIDDAAVQAALDRTSGVLADASAMMNDIGQYLRDQTEERFQTEKSPDGVPWAARSAATIAAYKRRAKHGGVVTWGGVLRYSGQMGGSIFHDFGPDWARIGSSKIYSAMMQFGGAKAAFPNLWGDIPARPFIGLADEDREGVIDIAMKAIAAALQG